MALLEYCSNPPQFDGTGATHREIFSKSDCIYHFPIDFEQQTDVRLVPNQSEIGNYNLISVWFNKISKIFLSVYGPTKVAKHWEKFRINWLTH